MEGNDKCPFCGKLATMHRAVKTAPTARKGLQIECMNCGARGPIYGDKKSALMGWRHGEPYRVDDPFMELLERQISKMAGGES